MSTEKTILATVSTDTYTQWVTCGHVHPTHKQALPCSKRLKAALVEHFANQSQTVVSVRQIPAADIDQYPTVTKQYGIEMPLAKDVPPTPVQPQGVFETAFSAMIAGQVSSSLASLQEEIEALTAQVAGLESRPSGVPVHTTLEIPALGKTIEIPPTEVQHPEFARLLRYVAGGVRRIWITGEAGTGKTHAVEAIARALGYPLYVVTPCVDKYELFGYSDAHGTYVPTELYRWATDPDPNAMLLIDEIDACQPAALVAANAALANGLAVFPGGQVPIAPTKYVIATANTNGEGPSLRYNARLAQDGALRDRFAAYLHWGVHDDTELAIALQQCPYQGTAEAVRYSQAIRAALTAQGIDLAWGPRRTYAMARLHAAGDTLRNAAIAAGLGSLESSQIDRVLR